MPSLTGKKKLIVGIFFALLFLACVGGIVWDVMHPHVTAVMPYDPAMPESAHSVAK